ncbi:MAG: response regulator [Rhodopila sp.]|jgi:CheY-like chemotaxis protein
MASDDDVYVPPECASENSGFANKPARPANGPPRDRIEDETCPLVGNRFRALELERHIGERLRFLRRLSGFSLQHIASEIGVSFQQIQKYESGANRVSAVLLAEFSSLFHLPMDWFIGPFNTCMERAESSGFAAYARVMQQLFRGLRDLEDANCHTALDVVCRLAKVAPGVPETRLLRLRHVLRDSEPDAQDFVVEVVTRLADAHVSGGVPDRNGIATTETPQTRDAAIRTILLVDDDPDVLRMLSASLSSAGFAVRSARSGDEALSLLASNVEIDAMVTDYAMAGIDGVELLAQAERGRPGLPGIVITGFADSARLGDLPPGIEVLSKPFRRMELIGRLRLLIDGQGGPASSRRQMPALRLVTSS